MDRSHRQARSPRWSPAGGRRRHGSLRRSAKAPRRCPHECNLLPIGRPVRQRGRQRRPGEWEPLAFVVGGSKERFLRYGNVRHPFFILGEVQLGSGYPGEFDRELARPQVITDELPAALVACHPGWAAANTPPSVA